MCIFSLIFVSCAQDESEQITRCECIFNLVDPSMLPNYGLKATLHHDISRLNEHVFRKPEYTSEPHLVSGMIALLHII